jgi:hypothetical protein
MPPLPAKVDNRSHIGTNMPASTKVRRTMHVKMRTPGMDAGQLLSLVKAAIPFYEAFGGVRIRLLRNVDDPAQFVQLVEYEMDAAIELNRQKIASDPMMRTYLEAWRSVLKGAPEIDVYEDVTG